jgi:hypothetical protein
MTLAKEAFLENSNYATDPSQIYGWSDGKPVRIKCSQDGVINVSGMPVPEHDQMVIDESDTGIILITYKSGGLTVATKSVVTLNSITTVTLDVL